MRRIFPSWLILTVLLAFISVSYFDCSHKTYQEIVNDHAHLVNTTRQQVSAMLNWLAIALYFYGLLLIFFLLAIVRNIKQK